MLPTGLEQQFNAFYGAVYEVSEGAIREALSVAMAVSAGKVRAQSREALKGLLDPLLVQ